MKDKLPKFCCVEAATRKDAVSEALEKVADMMTKIVSGRNPLFFLDGVTSG